MWKAVVNVPAAAGGRGWEGSTVPYVVAFIGQANQIFGPPGEWDPQALLGALEGIDSVREGIERFELLGAIEKEDQQRVAAEFLQLLPRSLDAAILAALRSALERGLRTQFTWKPGYAFELCLWESSKFEEDEGRWVGLVNIMIISPDPPEDQVAASAG
ncbi:MAG: hypothetical protein ACXWCM_15225 [Acidimicrobiales bacterium]